jgi:hypothetical protein
MRTIGEIVDAVQECQEASEEELRLTLVSLWYAYRMSARNSIEQQWKLIRVTPEHYLGPRWIPGTPENLEGRRYSKAMLNAFEKEHK